MLQPHETSLDPQPPTSPDESYVFIEAEEVEHPLEAAGSGKDQQQYTVMLNALKVGRTILCGGKYVCRTGDDFYQYVITRVSAKLVTFVDITTMPTFSIIIRSIKVSPIFLKTQPLKD